MADQFGLALVKALIEDKFKYIPLTSGVMPRVIVDLPKNIVSLDFQGHLFSPFNDIKPVVRNLSGKVTIDFPLDKLLSYIERCGNNGSVDKAMCESAKHTVLDRDTQLTSKQAEAFARNPINKLTNLVDFTIYLLQGGEAQNANLFGVSSSDSLLAAGVIKAAEALHKPSNKLPS